MIRKISVEESTRFHQNRDTKTKNQQTSPNFKGKRMDAFAVAMVAGMQCLERNPMIHVSALDFGTAIGPRTFFDSLTNIFSGFETLCRESSGLIVNCLIPGFIAILSGKFLDKFFVKSGAKDMANCFADSDTINKISKLYKDSNGDKTQIYKTLLSEIQGLDGNDVIKYSEKINAATYGEKLAKAADKTAFGKVVEELMAKTHVNENIRFGEKGAFLKDTSVSSLLENTRKFISEYEGSGKKEAIEQFATKARKLVKGKSVMGLAIVLPLAASMQYINRWVTEKLSGVKGAPIYEDFREARENPELHERLKAHAKEGLLTQKLISIGTMAGVAAASILLTATSKPNWKMLGKMLEFKGKYPTMDQARFISAVTFMSRMAASDDKNELRESRGRDIATFLSLYFLGDYAGKAAASAIEAKTGMALLNRSVVSPKDANIFTEFKNWVLNTHIKSSSELTFVEDAKKTAKAQKYRSACQFVNLLSSFAILGLIIYNRKQTQKKHAEAKELIKQQLELEKAEKQEQPKIAA